MTRILGSGDCGNSPKNQFVEKLAIAFARRDTEYLLKSVTDDISWHIVGEKSVRGKTEFAGALNLAEADVAEELTIEHVVTHGRAGAVNGTITSEDGKKRGFCDVFEFSNTKGTSIQVITSYRVRMS